jgi:TolB protein
MRHLQKRLIPVVLLALAAGNGVAQEGRIIINTDVKAKKGLYPIAVPPATGSDPSVQQLVTDVQSFDLGVSSWFKVLDPRSFLADLKNEGMSIDPRKWADVGAFGVVKTKVSTGGGQVTLEFKLYEVEHGAVPVLDKTYRGSVGDARKLAHLWANDVVMYFTGEPGFFSSQIAFNNSKKIDVMDFDGFGVYSLTKNDSINVLPAWSPTGRDLAFTSYMRGTPDLYVVSSGGGRPRRVSKFNGMNTGASYSPDGSKIALTLSKDGNPEIYIVSAADGTVLKRLTDNRFIDTSPAWSPDGSEIAFVSNREGTPQIFVMGADGSNQRRVSMVGSENQTPAWCPRKGVRVLAYTAKDDSTGKYDVVTIDLGSGKLTRITQNQGNNEEPTWSPNGRVLAFYSVRAGTGAGIYLANGDGTGEQKLVFKGEGRSPDWSPQQK